MNRRITIAIIGVVIATLLISGIGTVLLSRVGERKRTIDGLEDQAEALAELLQVATIPNDPDGLPAQERFTRFAQSIRLQGIGLLIYLDQPQAGSGQVLGEPPQGLTLDDLDIPALSAGLTISGEKGTLLYAASAAPRDEGLLIVALTASQEPIVGRTLRWLLLASGATIIIAVLISLRLGRRLAEPVRDATEATRRIAAGDLSTRLPGPEEASEDELAVLARSINAMAESLERSRGLERQFLMSVSHDLRTPLTSIRGYAEALADGTAEDATSAANVILSESGRLERLVSDLLDLAKLDAHRFGLTPRSAELNEIVQTALAGFLPELEEADIELEWDLGPPTIVEVDPDRLSQVVSNLAENALKFARGAIRVTTGSDGAAARIAITDDGPGISPDDLPHVFERLYVARHDPARKESGSGLGLAIVNELVKAMGGSVTAESTVGLGTSMSVRLPLPEQQA
ncbi:MAG: Sensor histidine kinase RcsC [Acidimicrobiales bacterium]|nr:MAG: sensor histidine kinase [Actinomycetota bacterium]MBV6509553.1 Sensor histidine kinase RcsC [Acidimicrobiales bacterium]RIK06584.1 MAG: hypothetical protein DCC48_06630 [Acidobacteriota bacterium]